VQVTVPSGFTTGGPGGLGRLRSGDCEEPQSAVVVSSSSPSPVTSRTAPTTRTTAATVTTDEQVAAALAGQLGAALELPLQVALQAACRRC
jgi:hypothetical protein